MLFKWLIFRDRSNCAVAPAPYFGLSGDVTMLYHSDVILKSPHMKVKGHRSSSNYQFQGHWTQMFPVRWQQIMMYLMLHAPVGLLSNFALLVGGGGEGWDPLLNRHHFGLITYPGLKEREGKRKTLRSPNVGLQPTTLGLWVPCSTDWVIQARVLILTALTILGLLPTRA